MTSTWRPFSRWQQWWHGETRAGLPPAQLLALFFIFLLLTFSRRPGDILHPQFYAEDGTFWYAQAYNFGWMRVTPIPYEGYLHLLPRLAAGLSLLVPLRFAPVALDLVGAVVQVLPAIFLLSRRAAPWGSLPLRCVLVTLYVICPNAWEDHVIISNAQWHLALLEVLVLAAEPPRTSLGRFGDVLLFVLGSMTGPFGLVLVPMLLLWWVVRRQSWTLIQAACLLPGSYFVLHTLATGLPYAQLHPVVAMPSRGNVDIYPLGASPSLFARIIGGNIVLAAMVGTVGRQHVPLLIDVLLLLFGTIVTACGLWFGTASFRLFTLFVAIIFGASLHSPVIADPISRWHGLSYDYGMRYFLYPSLVFLWAAVYALQHTHTRALRSSCAAVLVLCVAGLVRWEYHPYADHHFPAVVDQVNHAHSGEAITFPIQPLPWTMTLIKH